MKTRAPLYLLLPALLALGPFEKNPGSVDEGLRAFRDGRYEDALERFDAAKKEFPDRPELELNRGDALFKLGRLEEAKAAYEAAAASKDNGLRAKALANLGNTHVSANDHQKAIAAYRQSLRADPKDQEVRHNLEVLLRKIKPPPNQPNADGGTDGGQDGGTPDAGRPDGGGQQGDGGADGGDGGSADAGNKDGGEGDGGQSDAGQDGGQDGGSDGGQGDGGADGGDGGKGDGEGQGDGGRDGGADGGTPSDERTDGGTMDGGADGGSAEEGSDDAPFLDDAGMPVKPKTDAEKLLDALKQNEKNFPLWKYQRKNQKRPANGKDW